MLATKPILKLYNNPPYRVSGDLLAEDLMEETRIAGIPEFQDVKMDHKNLGKLSELNKSKADNEK